MSEIAQRVCARSFAEGLGELIGVFIRLFLGNSVMLLERAGELVVFAGDGGQLIIGELAPLLLDFARELFPVARDLIPVHDEPPGLLGVKCAGPR